MTETELKSHLQKECRQPADNPHFTRKVINSIPKASHLKAKRILAITYSLAIVVVVAAWLYLLKDFNFNSMLMPSGWLSIVTMSAVTAVIYTKMAKLAF